MDKLLENVKNRHEERVKALAGTLNEARLKAATLTTELTKVEAILALAYQFDRIATVLENQTKVGGALNFNTLAKSIKAQS